MKQASQVVESLGLRRAILLSMAAVFVSLAWAAPSAELPVLVKEEFQKGADSWEPTDAKAWKIAEHEGNKIYSLFQQSKYQPPYRSPLNFSLLKNTPVSDFTLDLKVRSTGRDYGHRDVCLVFGYQDPAHFYYVHLGKKTDDHANQIFIVNSAPRIKISTKTSEGTSWDDRWHSVKLVRRVQDGTIEVYFDDLEKPVMTATDKTFAYGRIGVGSFDDTGDFDDLVLKGVKKE